MPSATESGVDSNVMGVIITLCVVYPRDDRPARRCGWIMVRMNAGLEPDLQKTRG